MGGGRLTRHNFGVLLSGGGFYSPPFWFRLVAGGECY